MQLPPSHNDQRNEEAQKRQEDNGSFISRNLRRRVARRRAFRARLEVDRACRRKQRIPSQVEAARLVSRVLFSRAKRPNLLITTRSVAHMVTCSNACDQFYKPARLNSHGNRRGNTYQSLLLRMDKRTKVQDCNEHGAHKHKADVSEGMHASHENSSRAGTRCRYAPFPERSVYTVPRKCHKNNSDSMYEHEHLSRQSQCWADYTLTSCSATIQWLQCGRNATRSVV